MWLEIVPSFTQCDNKLDVAADCFLFTGAFVFVLKPTLAPRAPLPLLTKSSKQKQELTQAAAPEPCPRGWKNSMCQVHVSYLMHAFPCAVNGFIHTDSLGMQPWVLPPLVSFCWSVAGPTLLPCHGDCLNREGKREGERERRG